MCMEDIRIGRKAEGGWYPGTAQIGNPVEAIPANPHRTAIYFSGPGAGGGTAVFLTFSTEKTAGSGQGVTTANFGPGQFFTVKDLGNIITKAWYVQSNTANTPYAVLEGVTGEE